jgi:hypothetical protein
MKEQSNNESPAALMVQAFANMFLCRKFFTRFALKDKSQSKNLKDVSRFIAFTVALLLANQIFFFLTAPQNLYSQAGVTRKMNFGEVSHAISDKKVEIMLQEHIDLQVRLV